MTIPTLTPAPPAPSRSQDSATFNTRMAAMMAFIEAWPGELNDWAAALSDLIVAGLTATSASSVAIGTGAKIFAATPGAAFVPGHYLLISSTADPNNFMRGTVTGYDAGTGALAVNVTATGGAGTFASWLIGVTVLGADDPAAVRAALSVQPTNAPVFTGALTSGSVVTGGISCTSLTAAGLAKVAGAAAAAGFDQQDASAHLVVRATEAYGQNVGGTILLGGNYSSAGTGNIPFAAIVGAKLNGTNSNSAGALILKVNANGGAVAEVFRLTASGATLTGDFAMTGNVTTRQRIICAASAAGFDQNDVNAHLTVRATEAQGTGVGAVIALGGNYGTGGANNCPFATIQGVKNAASTSNTEGALLLTVNDQGGPQLTRMTISKAGAALTGMGTTASAANVFADASFNLLLKSTSARRFKTDIQDIPLSECYRIVKGLRGISYKSRAANDDKGMRFFGFLAEEAAQVSIHLVHWQLIPTDEIVRDERGWIVIDGEAIEPEATIETDLGVLIPAGVMYERVTVVQNRVIDDSLDRLDALEAAAAGTI